MGGKLTKQRATKIAAGGFPVTVGCQRTIELTLQIFDILRPQKLSATQSPPSVDTTRASGARRQDLKSGLQLCGVGSKSARLKQDMKTIVTHRYKGRGAD
jgi:hypothetical protein